MSQEKLERNPTTNPHGLLKGIKMVASKLDQNRAIYPLFGFFDSLNLVSTTVKYGIDMACINRHMNASDLMHDWLLSPVGIAIAVISSLSIIALSVYSNYYQEDAKCDLLSSDKVPTPDNIHSLLLSKKTHQAYIWVDNELYFVHKARRLIKKISLNEQDKTNFLNNFNPQRTPAALSKGQIALIQGVSRYNHLNAMRDVLAWIWPYLRDVCKAVKNGQKGMRSLLFMLKTLSGHSLNFLNLPLAITASILAALLRLWWRRMVENRKIRQDFNKALREEFLGYGLIKTSTVPSQHDLEKYTKDQYIITDEALYYFNFITQKIENIPFKEGKTLKSLMEILDIEKEKGRLASDEDRKLIMLYTGHTPCRDKYLEQKKQDILFTLDIDNLKKWVAHYDARLYQIKRQPLASITAAYAAVALGGVIDTTYLYVGLLTLATYTWPLFVAMSVLCIVFSVVQILVRIYEEYVFQEKLKVSVLEAEIVILETQIETLISTLNLPQHDNKTMLDEILKKSYEHYQSSRKQLNNINTKHNVSAILEGFRAGLGAFGAVAAGLFGASTFMALAGVVFPPILIISLVAAGVAALIGFTCYTLYTYYKHRKSIQANTIQDIFADYLSKPQEQAVPNLKKVKNFFHKSSCLPAPPVYFQEFLELFRSFLSGIGKGFKSIDYTLNPVASQGGDGHYHETPVMIVLGGIAAFFYALIFALRALAKGFSRLPLAPPDEVPQEIIGNSQIQIDEQPSSEEDDVNEWLIIEIEKNPPIEEHEKINTNNVANMPRVKSTENTMLSQFPTNPPLEIQRYGRCTFTYFNNENQVKNTSCTKKVKKLLNTGHNNSNIMSKEQHTALRPTKSHRFFSQHKCYAQDDIGIFSVESLTHKMHYDQVNPVTLQRKQQNKALTNARKDLENHRGDDVVAMARVNAIIG